MNVFVALLYTLVLPYIGLMLLVIVGLLRRRAPERSAKTPSVSVIIPAHNEEARLPATLHSLAAQRYGGALEFVIVNDRSTDATDAIIRAFSERDPRFRLVSVTAPSRRLSPKVNAVNTGIAASTGEIILTSDADCQFSPDWVAGMVSHFAPDVAMVLGYVESTRPGDGAGLVQRLESADWLSLMLTSMALTHFGWKVASSANNQGYRRSAFEAIGGFGASGRAPSGDEDLLTQRMGRLQAGRIVFASAPETRVLTRPMANAWALLSQRRRWVSRYRHLIHYHPLFWLAIVLLGAQSVALSASVLATPLLPALAPYVFGLWALKLGVELTGMHLGEALMDRRDLGGLTTLLWALLHPFYVAVVALWALFKTGEWRAGAQPYHRRFVKRQLRELRRGWRRRLRGEAL
ncbi:glycosyltransferase [Truepera radiovictrix]|uniref:Glycosyl transferase family 2 n=1 Tax=Truepera radiovictrix (strain DSM 17093 / CIP 108686 / LMG 22925 / RQ-24) TaxID=649638 RepID=D7CQS7_TRURR|nr:glycosyltransferase [Truepera radiovictrix]ADI15061.1 glycosyl transferase family 2 [Truepera radiovictrix DSM 17093]WMT56386.1 glycosyltransferase [Truepera radiovictrix]